MPTSFRSLTPRQSDSSEDNLKMVCVALGISLLVHVAVGFFTRDSRLHFLTADSSLSIEQRLELRGESAIRARIQAGPEMKEPDSLENDAAKLFEPPPRTAVKDTPSEFVEAANTDAPASFFAPPNLVQAQDTTQHGIKPPADTVEATPVIPWQPREKIIEIASRFANDDLAVFARREIPAIERFSGVPDIVAPSLLTTQIEGASALSSGSYAMPKPAASILLEPEKILATESEKMPEVIEAGPVASGEEAAAFFAVVPEEVAPAKPIENVLSAGIHVYRPKRDDGFVYFRVDVTRKGADVLPPIARDILLVQDASASLSEKRLYHSRKAFEKILSSGLLPTDRINILAFNTETSFAFPDWVPATPENIQKALAFTKNIRASGNTDIYKAMNAVCDLTKDPSRTALVFLVSDGRATAGDIRRDSQIIGEFSRLNSGNVSVFNIGVSSRSDEYLLSMLSFCNRGGAAAIAKDSFSIPETFLDVYRTVSSPVLSHIRFIFDSASEAIVTPQKTTNLYLDRPLSLYGRAPLGSRKVTFQARGKNAQQSYDMIFSLNLGSPAPGSGDKNIAQQWARTRIYDLVADFAEAPDSQILAEMREISDAHDITLPFGKRFRLP